MTQMSWAAANFSSSHFFETNPRDCAAMFHVNSDLCEEQELHSNVKNTCHTEQLLGTACTERNSYASRNLKLRLGDASVLSGSKVSLVHYDSDVLGCCYFLILALLRNKPKGPGTVQQCSMSTQTCAKCKSCTQQSTHWPNRTTSGHCMHATYSSTTSRSICAQRQQCKPHSL